ncbi:TonB-dependent receptor [Pseudomonas sp. GD03858]|uniref:TonB-dependent receptor plug domain-containing protein n=1 Tax=unclassified Pseudomonas TaxID=196821 RepID=UPI002449C313|nr:MULTISPECIES: TonB-dependent receptor [unclassified Pseudomonas]MDH0648733.1 TonB-dependent receptor [Pseudomonas sp. GD03867]MDH0664943.1 TonB-dependent receptor [Pseudomonas sp. GD03858]
MKSLAPRLSLAALAAMATSPAFADEQEKPFTLGEIRISAPQDDKLATGSSVVEAADMRLHDRETVDKALALAPGVNLAYIGGRAEQVVFVRGFDRLQVPVFIDGIPTYVPYDGNIDLGRFTTYDLSRVEVAKGFASLLYGPNTLGGAINLVTRRPTQAFEGEVGGGLELTDHGNVNAYRSYVNAGSNQGNWWMQGGVSYVDYDYTLLPDDFKPTNNQQGEGRRENSDKRDGKFSFKLGLTPNDTDEYVLGYVQQQGRKGQPPYAGDLPATGQRKRWWEWPTWDKTSLFLATHTRFGEHGLKTRVYHDTFKNSLESFTYNNGIVGPLQSGFPSKYDDESSGFSIEGDLALAASNRLGIAYHFKEDVHRSRDGGDPWTHFRDQTQSIALEDTWKLDEVFSVVGGVSYNYRKSLDAENFGTNTASPRVKTLYDEPTGSDDAVNAQLGLFINTGPLLAIDHDGQVRLTVARKSRFATIKDRYSTRFGTVIPSPDLKSERATHYELGYAGSLSDLWSLDAALFISEIEDSIQQVTVAPQPGCAAPCGQYQNIAKARNQGVELGLKGDIGDWQLGASYTYLDRQNRSNPDIRPVDTPRHNLFASATWNQGAWRHTGSVEAASRRYSASDGTQVANGYAIYNLKTGYTFANDLRIEAGVRNLFDRLYEYTEGYPEMGRNYFVQFNVPL